MDPAGFRSQVEAFIREHELIDPNGDVTVLVSAGPDSTALWHVLRELGYRVSALHVDHGLRGEESDADARFCRDVLGAEVVDGRGGATEDELREIRYAQARDRLRATGHTRDDQVETVLYRLVASGAPGGIKVKREDGIVRPLLERTRAEVLAYLEQERMPYRLDTSNPATKRGLIREQILPLLRQLHPAAEENLLRLAERATMPPEVAELLASTTGSKRLDLGSGVTLVREYDRAWVEPSPRTLEGVVRWGQWKISAEEKGLKVRTWRPGDRLAGRRKKIQDVFVDAKIPRTERDTWPLVVRGDEVVAVPGLVEAPGVKAERVAD
jgi:tRNA(Ile)-lysidine synthetase-like protein